MEKVRQIFICFLRISLNWFTLLSPTSLLLTAALQQGHKRGCSCLTRLPLWADWCCRCFPVSLQATSGHEQVQKCIGPLCKLLYVHFLQADVSGPFLRTPPVVWNVREDLTGNTFLPGWNAFIWQWCKNEDGYLNNTGSCRAGPESMSCIAVRSLVSAPTSWSSLTKALWFLGQKQELVFWEVFRLSPLLAKWE